MDEFIDDVMGDEVQWQIVLEKLRFLMATDYDWAGKGISGLMTDIAEIVEEV